MTSEFVHFEVSDVAASARLAERLSDRWNIVLSAERSDVMVLVVELRPGPRDLAVLLRDVEAWVEEESLCAIRYELDGRGYVLEAGGLQWSLDAAPEVADEAAERRARLLDALDSVDRAISNLGGDPDGKSTPVRGLEGLRDDIVFALRLADTSS
jgi:hypothetical protein